MNNDSFCLVPKQHILDAVNNYRIVKRFMEEVGKEITKLVMEACSEKRVFGLFNKSYRFFSEHDNCLKYLPDEYYGNSWQYISKYEVGSWTFNKLEAMCQVSDEIYLSKIDSVIVNVYRGYTVEVVSQSVYNKLRESQNRLFDLGERDVAIKMLRTLNSIEYVHDLEEL